MADPKDIKKSVEETVNQILSAGEQPANGGATQLIADPTAEAAKKAMPNSSPANGGEDKIKSGSPLTEEQKAEEAKKAQAAAEAAKAAESDVAKKAKEDEKKDDDKDADDKDDKKDDKKKDAAKSKMKKSIEELADHLDAEELELVKTWREECAASDAVAKSQTAEPIPAQNMPTMAQIEEVLKKAVSESTAEFKKSLDEKDTLIKGLNEKIEKMASKPAYDRRSISTLETLEKSGSDNAQLTKSQVLDKMLELQAAGKGVTSHHIAEFEATRNISDPTVRGIVFRELKVN